MHQDVVRSIENGCEGRIFLGSYFQRGRLSGRERIGNMIPFTRTVTVDILRGAFL